MGIGAVIIDSSIYVGAFESLAENKKIQPAKQTVFGRGDAIISKV